MPQLFVLLLILLPLQAMAGSTPADCKLFVYPVDAQGHIADQPITTPKQVLSVTDKGTDPRSGMQMRLVVFTVESAAINSAYTREHIGEKVAIFCGRKENLRPVIAGESSNKFVIVGS